ncbi:hypothetical protein [Ruegeria atlantica]|uniref:hypothetical protein n=1 Tax=Ruegeria atlantica TaxID=81569 RepID=UPI0024949E00|nr:hypothetical protein [Ruegeria atlantica]
MTKPKPNPFADAQRVDTTATIMRRLKVSREEAERVAALPPGKVSALDFIKLRLLNLDGPDPREDHIEAESAYTAVQSVLSERNSARGKNARPGRRPHHDEVIRRAMAIVERSPNMAGSARHLAERVYDEMSLERTADEVAKLTSEGSIARWIRAEFKKNGPLKR